jgi:hypothetical protein
LVSFGTRLPMGLRRCRWKKRLNISATTNDTEDGLKQRDPANNSHVARDRALLLRPRA